MVPLNFNPTVDDAWLASDTLLLADTFSVSDLVSSDVLHQLLGPLMLDKYSLVAFVGSRNSMRNIDAVSQAN
jgi:predicted ATPase